MSDMKTLLDPSPMRKQREVSQKLVTKWEKSGLLEGMDNEWQRSGMAVLLENQARQLISEASRTSPTPVQVWVMKNGLELLFPW